MKRQINIEVDDLLYARLAELARKAGMKPTGYARVLFEAAYAARWGKSGDPDLDAQVGIALVLHGAKQDSATIARALRLQEATVLRIIDAWRQQKAAAA